MKAYIIKTNRTSSGKLIDYILQLEDESEIRITSNEIKERIQGGEFEVVGMKLDATGRLVRAGKDSTSAPSSSAPKAAKKPAAPKRTIVGTLSQEPLMINRTTAAGKTEDPAKRPKAFVKVRIV